jgi:hypothetical protein
LVVKTQEVSLYLALIQTRFYLRVVNTGDSQEKIVKQREKYKRKEKVEW